MSVKVRNVLYVSTVSSSLFFVRKLSGWDFNVQFTGNNCDVISLKNGKVKAKAILAPFHLYELKLVNTRYKEHRDNSSGDGFKKIRRSRGSFRIHLSVSKENRESK